MPAPQPRGPGAPDLAAFFGQGTRRKQVLGAQEQAGLGAAARGLQSLGNAGQAKANRDQQQQQFEQREGRLEQQQQFQQQNRIFELANVLGGNPETVRAALLGEDPAEQSEAFSSLQNARLAKQEATHVRDIRRTMDRVRAERKLNKEFRSEDIREIAASLQPSISRINPGMSEEDARLRALASANLIVRGMDPNTPLQTAVRGKVLEETAASRVSAAINQAGTEEARTDIARARAERAASQKDEILETDENTREAAALKAEAGLRVARNAIETLPTKLKIDENKLTTALYMSERRADPEFVREQFDLQRAGQILQNKLLATKVALAPLETQTRIAQIVYQADVAAAQQRWRSWAAKLEQDQKQIQALREAAGDAIDEGSGAELLRLATKLEENLSTTVVPGEGGTLPELVTRGPQTTRVADWVRDYANLSPEALREKLESVNPAFVEGLGLTPRGDGPPAKEGGGAVDKAIEEPEEAEEFKENIKSPSEKAKADLEAIEGLGR